MDIIGRIYDIWKRNRASKAQKKARKQAEQQAYRKLLSSSALMEVVNQMADLEAMFLKHMELHGVRNASQMGRHIAEPEDLPAPPPPKPGTVKQATPPKEKNPRQKGADVLARYHSLKQ